MNKNEEIILKSKIFLRSLKNVQFQIFLISLNKKLKQQYFQLADEVIEKYNKKEDYKHSLSYQKFQVADYIQRTKINPFLETICNDDFQQVQNKIDHFQKIFYESLKKIDQDI